MRLVRSIVGKEKETTSSIVTQLIKLTIAIRPFKAPANPESRLPIICACMHFACMHFAFRNLPIRVRRGRNDHEVVAPANSPIDTWDPRFHSPSTSVPLPPTLVHVRNPYTSPVVGSNCSQGCTTTAHLERLTPTSYQNPCFLHLAHTVPIRPF